mmetsp:Transcript_1070/g.3337  ORF Transcript_1070/g.3337 Transcript_1070/m.3337 type:complete len:165 (-) Transcript_1070:1675-2169(-)
MAPSHRLSRAELLRRQSLAVEKLARLQDELRKYRDACEEQIASLQEDERELVKLTCSAEESSYVESDVEAELMRETLDYLLENEGGFAERNTPSGAPHSLHASGDGKSKPKGARIEQGMEQGLEQGIEHADVHPDVDPEEAAFDVDSALPPFANSQDLDDICDR